MSAVSEAEQAYHQQEFEAHPFAEILPLIQGTEFEQLAADIGRNGLLNPLLLFEGKILDGRNRYRACKHLGFVFYADNIRLFNGGAEDALDMVVAQNLRRRHLSASERAMSAAKAATLRNGLNAVRNEGAVTLQDAADRFDVSKRSIVQARNVLKDAAPHIVAMVERGELTLLPAERISELPLEKQAEFKSADQVTAHLKAQPTRMTGRMASKVLEGLADLMQLPPKEVIAMLRADDREALAELTPKYVAFLEALAAIAAGGGGCVAAE